MSETTKIEWCDHTFNPWIGCTKVSPGCANCYAEGESKRRGWAKWGRGQPRHRTSEAYWREPLKWNRAAGTPPPLNPIIWFRPRQRVFCASLADVFDQEVPTAWRRDLFNLIYDTPNLDWLILTKRIEEAREWYDISDAAMIPNIWLGASVEDQRRKTRIDVLRELTAAIRFLSLEPLLEDLGELDLTGIHWVIVGGESGPNARPCNVEWIRSISNQCSAAKVPVFVKQLGAKVRASIDEIGFPKRLSHRKGGDPGEWPADLRVREFPR